MLAAALTGVNKRPKSDVPPRSINPARAHRSLGRQAVRRIQCTDHDAWTPPHFEQCRASASEVLSVPKARQWRGGQPVAKRNEVVAVIENDAIGEPFLTRFGECTQTNEVAGLHRRGCLDFDPHDRAVIAFQRGINFAQLFVSNMINRV